jgi:hypothetical protein
MSCRRCVWSNADKILAPVHGRPDNVSPPFSAKMQTQSGFISGIYENRCSVKKVMKMMLQLVQLC